MHLDTSGSSSSATSESGILELGDASTRDESPAVSLVPSYSVLLPLLDDGPNLNQRKTN